LRKKRAEKLWKRLRENSFFRFCRRLLRRYSRHDISRQGAALSYYLLFTMFPLLIFLSALLGRLEVELEPVLKALGAVLPEAVVELCETYLTYVSEIDSGALLWFSLVFSVYFPMRSANCLLRGVRRAYGIGRPARPLLYYLRLFLYTLCLIVLIGVALMLTVVGGRLLSWVGRWMALPGLFVRLWPALRFALLAVFLFAALGTLYALAQDRPQKPRGILPGTLAALLAWMALSLGFSFYVEHFANYSVIYGALGAVIILLIWLHLSAVTVLLGAELNAMLAESNKRNRSPGEEKTI